MKRNFLFRVLFLLAAIGLLLGAAYFAVKAAMPDLFELISSGNAEALEAYIETTGRWRGLLCVALLQVLQVWVTIISAMPIQFAAAIVFGAEWVFPVCSAATVLGLAISFFAWGHIGRLMERLFPVSEKNGELLEKYLNLKLPPFILLLMLCFLFFMPNGLIPVLASRTDIKMRSFLIAVTPGISFNVLVVCLAGDRLMEGDWISTILVVGIGILIAVLIGLNSDRILHFMERRAERAKSKSNG